MRWGSAKWQAGISLIGAVLLAAAATAAWAAEGDAPPAAAHAATKLAGHSIPLIKNNKCTCWEHYWGGW